MATRLTKIRTRNLHQTRARCHVFALTSRQLLRLPTARRPRKIPLKKFSLSKKNSSQKNSVLVRKIPSKKFRLTKIENSKLRTLKALLILRTDRRVLGERERGKGRGCYAAEKVSYVTPIFGLRCVTVVTRRKTLLLPPRAETCYGCYMVNF
jgi:hypothetical protein